MNNTGISRRHFAQLLGVGAACAAINPRIAFAEQPAARASAVVRLSSNENPYGPSARALKAMSDAFSAAWRYPDEHAEMLVDAIAQSHGISREQILVGDGSSEILKVAASAFTGANRALVAADPTFEAILKFAQINRAEVVKVPLASSFAHDLSAMSAKKAGLVYICNPNNPTASITPKNDLRAFIAAAPGETMILVDEAYFHYADSADYESVIPLVKEHANLIVARTFSKIYGMAGLRCGYCIAQKETIERMRAHQPWDSVNVIALAAATASLGDNEQVANGRRLNSETKSFVVRELERLGYATIPSQANFIMTDLKRPVVPLIAAMKQRNVQIGRLFPALPNHMRVTIGKKAEMDAFLSAFRDAVT